jgi:hypothetical protein
MPELERRKEEVKKYQGPMNREELDMYGRKAEPQSKGKKK